MNISEATAAMLDSGKKVKRKNWTGRFLQLDKNPTRFDHIRNIRDREGENDTIFMPQVIDLISTDWEIYE